jgi:hypothetical protein
MSAKKALSTLFLIFGLLLVSSKVQGLSSGKQVVPHWLSQLLFTHHTIRLEVAFNISASCEINQIQLLKVHPGSVKSQIPGHHTVKLVKQMVGPEEFTVNTFETELLIHESNGLNRLKPREVERKILRFMLPDDGRLECHYENHQLISVTHKENEISQNWPAGIDQLELNFPGLSRSYTIEYQLAQ